MENQKPDLSDIPLFRTGLYIPEYLEGEIGNWRIQKSRFRFDYGYVTDVALVENMAILSRRSMSDSGKWEVWMSIAPHEIESQELSCRYAHGHTVVMGLGLGLIAINTALNKMVDKVTVVELDSDVIRLFDYSGALNSLPAEIYDKIEIVQADALIWNSDDRKTDFLFVDIWRTLAEHSVLEDLHSIQNNTHADQIYYWGQELTIYSELQKSESTCKQINKETIHYCIDHLIQLPLLIPEDFDYPEMIIRAVNKRQILGLPLSK